MKILKLNISNFGLLHNKRIELSEGLNLIYGENESGKSTIHSFIKGMLFGIDKSRGRPTFNDMYDKYQPWKTPGSYDGSLEFEVDKKSYHIYRNFEKNNKEMIVTNVDTGRKLELSQAEFQELLGGITKAAYDGTISIEQLKAKTDDDLVYELQNHITNLSMTKSEEIDVKKALDNL
ncbi:MAG TPA: AAA family ATPase, partial [Clostridiales bacterium]|nr:AAA family ATPase [Clostridiales bacterium]